MRGEKITDRLVAAAEARDRLYFVWDRDLKGFGLKVSSTGRKTFLVQYRLGRGRGHPTKRYTIGAAGSPWTAQIARAEAERILHIVGLGGDPREEARNSTRAQVDLRFDKFAQRFLERYARPRWGDRTYKNHESNIRRWIIPVFRSKPISKMTRIDITELLDRLPVSKPSLPRTIFVLLRKMFNWAVERGEIEASPMNGMKVPPLTPERHHILADHELVTVAACAPELGPTWGHFIHMLILTGQRRTEVSEATWHELDRVNRVWTIPGARTKNGRDHVVPLSSTAIIALDANAGSSEWPDSGFVFSHFEGRPISGYSKMKARLDDVVASFSRKPVAPWRIHDLRRTVATNLQRIGVRFEVTEAILNHVSVTQAGVSSVYQRHDWWKEKQDAMEEWGERFKSMIDHWPKSVAV